MVVWKAVIREAVTKKQQIQQLTVIVPTPIALTTKETPVAMRFTIMVLAPGMMVLRSWVFTVTVFTVSVGPAFNF